jgi:hypothetical protein
MAKLNTGIIEQRFAELEPGDYFWASGLCWLKVLPYESATLRGVNAYAQPAGRSDIERRWFYPYEFVRKVNEVGSG